MLRSSLQERINPPAVQQGKNFSDVAVKSASQVSDPGSGEKADFRDLLMNSNREIKDQREAAKVADGDLASAKTEEEFLQKLADKTSKNMRVPKNTMDKDDFLKLFVTQLQQQDPFQPKDSSEMASQMAQFNSLEQMMNFNKGLDNLAKMQGSSRNMSLVNYVGKDLTVKGGRIKLEGGKISDASFTLEHPTTEAKLQVRDGSGQVIHEEALGSLPPGEHKLEWNGKSKSGKDMPSGTYAYSIEATGSDGKPIPVDTNTRVRVTGVDIAGDGSFFTELGKFRPEDIQAVGEAGFKRFVAEAKVEKDKIATAAAPAAQAAPAREAAPPSDATPANDAAPALVPQPQEAATNSAPPEASPDAPPPELVAEAMRQAAGLQ